MTQVVLTWEFALPGNCSGLDQPHNFHHYRSDPQSDARNLPRRAPYSETLTLMGLIDKADQDLREARDMYAYLAVYAPEYRFRADAGYITTTLPGHPAPLCGATDKENPDPPDPTQSGLVLDPVIDWCNFPARPHRQRSPGLSEQLEQCDRQSESE